MPWNKYLQLDVLTFTKSISFYADTGLTGSFLEIICLWTKIILEIPIFKSPSAVYQVFTQGGNVDLHLETAPVSFFLTPQ